MTSFLSFLLGVVLAAAFAGFALAVMRGRETRLKRETAQAMDQAEKAFELIASYPHGLIIRDFVSGRDIATAELTGILGLRADSERAFDDLCHVLTDDDATKLRTASSTLTQHGKAYVLDVQPKATDIKTLRLVGRLASSAQGKPVAQVIWVMVPEGRSRPALETSQPMKARAFAIPQGDDRVAVETLLDILPFPAWRRDQALDPVYINAPGRETKAVESATDLARTALEEGTLARTSWPDADGMTELSIIEAPLEGAFGTIGFALSNEAAHAAKLKKPSSIAQDLSEQVFDGLSQAVVIFDANQKLQTYNAAYRTLWSLDESWLKTAPSFRQVLDRLRERRLLPEFPDYRSFRDDQSGMFDRPKPVPREQWHLPDGRTLVQSAIPLAQGGLALIYEDVSSALALERAAKTSATAQRVLLSGLQDGVAIFSHGESGPLFNDAFADLWPTITAAHTIEAFLDDLAERPNQQAKAALQGLKKAAIRASGPMDIVLTTDGQTRRLSLIILPDHSLALIGQQK